MEDSSHTLHPNFIIFGEMGAGKSSLINLIAGNPNLAEISSGAKSCTLESAEYPIRLPDSQCQVNLYDTAGLDEPTMDNATYVDAVGNAYDLINSLQKKGGVRGLLFCIRGRITATVQGNYKLFYEVLCEKKVPVTLVITFLENEPGDMDNWWADNQAHVEKSGIASVAHVCITTTKGLHDVNEDRYLESRKKVHKMLNELAGHVAYSVDGRGWFIRVCMRLLELLAPRKWLLGRKRGKMMEVLTRHCKLRKEDAEQLLGKIEDKEKEKN